MLWITRTQIPVISRRWGMATSRIAKNLPWNSSKASRNRLGTLPRRISWRLWAGVGLIGVSVAAMSWVLQSGSESRPVAVLGSSVAMGQKIGDSDLTWVEVPLSSAFDRFLSEPEWRGSSDLVAARLLEAGVFLTEDDVVEPTMRDDSMITLTLSVGSPPWLAPGQRAQLWVAPPLSENAFSSPFVLSPEVIIDRVAAEDGFAADNTVSLVDVRVPLRDLPGAIHAVANNYFVYLTPVSLYP